MPLANGTRLGPYEIQSAIGAGGMGEVYRARDSRLDRTVAIKVLPAELSADQERRARFQREAKTIAGLNHPHICTLHDVGEHPSTGPGQPALYLVMEHLPGETLADRLRRGPLPVGQALEIGAQIADALDAAHKHGVIHRDLKPGNVMLTKSGAKLLDFGLVKLTGHGEQPAAVYAASAIPTRAATLTGEGRIVGTLHYMAPEQVEGKAADARTDHWALGAILYEMVTGKRAFEGTSAASLIAAILEREPVPLLTLQPLAPPGMDRLVKRCLAKDPNARWDSAHDVADELRWLAGEPASQASTGKGIASAADVRFWKMAAAVLALLVAGLAGAIGYGWLKGRPASPPVWSMELPAGTELTEGATAPARANMALVHPYPTRTEFALSADGTRVAFSAVAAGTGSPPLLYLRSLDRAEADPVQGTEGARQPCFSPDGQSVAFWAKGKLYRVPVQGRVPQELASSPSLPKGISWGDDGQVYWGGGNIRRVPANGGAVEHVTKVDPNRESSHTLPFVLPGGKALLFTVTSDDYSDQAHVEVVSLPAGARDPLIDDAADARFLPPGHLVFMRRGALMAAAFDPQRLKMTGMPIPVVSGVEQALNAASPDYHSGAGQFSVSQAGWLAYVPGGTEHLYQCEVVLVDRDGRTEVLPGFDKPEVTNQVRLSPDGKRLAFVQQSGPLWLFDLERATHTRISPARGLAGAPRWRPDGQRIAFNWSEGGLWNGWQVSPDASDKMAPLIENAPGLWLNSWSPDGRFIAGVRSSQDTGWDILIWDTEERKLIPFLQSPAWEACPEFSPDGRWLAYSSDKTGRREVYLRSFPDGVPEIPVSSQGGNEPAFSRDGRELFFLSPAPARMMKVDITLGPTPAIGRPEPLFDFQFLLSAVVRGYDLASDGRRFLCTRVKQSPRPAAITRIRFVEHWTEELKAKVPIK